MGDDFTVNKVRGRNLHDVEIHFDLARSSNSFANPHFCLYCVAVRVFKICPSCVCVCVLFRYQKRYASWVPNNVKEEINKSSGIVVENRGKPEAG